MTTIYIDAGDNHHKIQRLVQTAVEAEINRFEQTLEADRLRLTIFEQKYQVSSEHFIAEMAAEDLEGGDDEYVQWIGEYRLMERLQFALEMLQGIEYRDVNSLRTD